VKLFRYGELGNERPAVLDDNGIARDISSIIPDITPKTIVEINKLAKVDLASLPAVKEVGRIGACVGDVGKMICIGLNYVDHAKETGLPIPEEPIVFMKATSAICGPNDNVIIPKGSKKTDWEVELGVVIGKIARYVSESNAEDHILGYCLINDVSEREFQLERGGQWDKGKGADTFGPTGPWLVTKDEIPDPQNLPMFLEVDGERVQNGNTKTMIFTVRQIVSYVSQFMSLQPGDIISTGTPPGVGSAFKPPRFLRPGQTMELEIEGLGRQRQTLVAYEDL
jgi:2,4-diketo-3-deoxy-L-fuconate hydrolase